MHFVDVTREAGLEFRHETGARGDKWMPDYGQRLRAFDYDGDGWLDVLLVNSDGWGGEKAPGKLYRNLGNGTFADATQRAGPRFLSLWHGRDDCRLRRRWRSGYLFDDLGA